MIIEWKRDLSDDARKLRLQVYSQELGFTQEGEFDQHDESQDSWHLYVNLDGQLAGYTRMHYEPYGWCLARVVVSKEYRSHKIGKNMILECLEKAFQMGLNVLWISALNHVVEYYCRFGFHVESDYYMEEHLQGMKLANRNIQNQQYDLKFKWQQKNNSIEFILLNFTQQVGTASIVLKQNYYEFLEFEIEKSNKQNVFEKFFIYSIFRKVQILLIKGQR